MLRLKKISLLLVAAFAAIFVVSCSEDDKKDVKEALVCSNLDSSLVKTYSGDGLFNGSPLTNVTATIVEDGSKDGCSTYKISFDKSDIVFSGLSFIQGNGNFASNENGIEIGINKDNKSLGIKGNGVEYGSNEGGGTTPPGDETPTPPGDETPTPPGDETPTPPGDETPTPPGDETPGLPGIPGLPL